MTPLHYLFSSLLVCLLAAAEPLQLTSQPSSNDPGAEVIAQLKGSLIYATNGETVEGSKVLTGAARDFITSKSGLEYKEYYLIGKDNASVFRTYQTWLQPIKRSEALMLSGEPKSISDDGITFDMKFWQDKKEIFSVKSSAKYNAPFIITGPSWRDGKLLYILELNKK